MLHYYAATEIVRWEDFELEYENPDDKYSSFGNGVTTDGFVPDRFPWVHPPPEQNVAPPKYEPFPSAFGFPSWMWFRGKIKLSHILSAKVSS